MMPKMNYAKILEQRECPSCKFNKPGTKGDCMIKQHVVFGASVATNMKAWIEKQIFTGVCKQRKVK